MSSKTFVFACWLLAVTLAAISGADAQEYTWPAYSPNIAYDFNTQFGPLDPPTKVLPGVSGVQGVYAKDWWCFIWGANKNPEVTDAAWIPMIERFNKDFAFMTDIMGWPRDVRAQDGYYSTVYLFGSGLSTDNASNTDPGGWMGTTVWNGKPWHCVLASYIPVKAFNPATPDGYQSGAMIHEGIHAIFAPMTGGNQSAWAQESFNVWLQGTMESLRNGSFTGMGGLSVGSQIAPFIPIQCYSGWLQDGSFGGPNAEGVNKATAGGQQVCTWRQILGGYQYGEAFPHAMEVILGPKSIPWMWNSTYSGYLLKNIGLGPGGIGDAQMRRFIKEYRGRQAFCDFKQWSYAFRQLISGYWGTSVEEEWSPYDIDVQPWIMTCYVATTNNGGTLTPEARTLPGWSGANQIPLMVSPSATNVSVTFNPLGANMSCQLVYRDTSGAIHYGTPVDSGVCSIPVANVLNNVVVAVVCNTDYVWVDDTTRTTKYDYRLTMGSGITGTADIYTKWFDYNPATYTVTASAGANGTIHPSGAVVVNNGSVQTFTFAPASGYKVDKVLLNGLPVGSPTSYTLNPVRSDLALQVTFRDATPPAAPGGLGAVAVNGSVNLDWADNSEPDFASYRVYRSKTSGSGYALIASGVTASNYTDTTAVHGTTYYYVVTALDVEANASGYSNQASAVAIDTVAPAAPTGLVVESVGSSAFLDWADNSEADLASYTVYRSTTSGSGYVAIATGLTSSSYTDSSIVLGTTYYYVVTAKDRSGNQSVYSTQLTPVSKLLAKWDFNDPSLGAANGATLPNVNGAGTTWRAAADKSGKGNYLTTASQTSGRFTWSSNSQEGNLSIKASSTAPSAFTRSDKSLPTTANDVEKFTGTAFTVEALATISGSNIYRNVVGREAYNLSTSNPGSTALNLGLDDQNRAWFAYVDVNGKNVDIRSSVTFAADDTVFHHFAASTDGSTVSLYVDGVLVAQTTGAGMAGLGIGNTGSGYRPGAWCVGRGLYYANQNDRWFGYIDSVSITGLTLKPGTFVLSSAGANDTAPAAPASLAATAGDGSVGLDWPDSTEPDFATYTVYRSSISGSGYALIRSGLTTSAYTVPAAPNGKTYYYVVTATDAAGNESTFSVEAAATPIDVTPPASPTGLTATAGQGSVTLNWADNTDSDLASYTVYRSTSSGAGYTALASGLTVSAFVDNSGTIGTTYYYVVTALDTSALESANSAEASATFINVPVVEFWNFEDGTNGSAFSASAAGGSTGINGTVMRGFDTYYGPYWINSTAPNAGSSLAMDCADEHQDGYLTSGALHNWTAPDWTVELHAKFDTMNGWETMIGRDGSSFGVPESDFYFQRMGDGSGKYRISYRTADGVVKTVVSNTVLAEDVWYGLAVVCNSTAGTISLYIDTGSGYALDGQLTGLTGNLGVYSSAINWTFGRGWYNGSQGDRTDATFDNIRFSAAALAPSQLIPLSAAPAAPTGLVATPGNGIVSLDWADNTGPNLASYTVYRSITSGSGFASIASGLVASNYIDSTAVNGTTYYYRVTAKNVVGNESSPSSEVSATPVDLQPPAAPTGLVATAGNGTVQLDWADNTDPDLASYKVYRSTTSGSGYSAIASGLVGSAYSDSTVVNGTTYYYVVTATDFSANESNMSTEVSAIPMTPAQSWRSAQFGMIDNSGIAADDQDPDFDGIKNILERAFAGNPNGRDANLLPAIDDTAPLLSITYRKSKAATDLTFTVQESDLTGAWTTATGSSQIVSEDNAVQVIRFTSPAGVATKKFLRLVIGQSGG